MISDFGDIPHPMHAVWLVHEQVAIAALDCSSLPFAASLIRAVARRFPTASRTRRLQVLWTFWRSVCLNLASCSLGV